MTSTFEKNLTQTHPNLTFLNLRHSLDQASSKLQDLFSSLRTEPWFKKVNGIQSLANSAFHQKLLSPIFLQNRIQERKKISIDRNQTEIFFTKDIFWRKKSIRCIFWKEKTQNGGKFKIGVARLKNNVKWMNKKTLGPNPSTVDARSFKYFRENGKFIKSFSSSSFQVSSSQINGSSSAVVDGTAGHGW